MFNLIVAVCRNNGIGLNGKIPWHIKQDIEYFSKITKGDGNNAVIMGRKTWESLPKHLVDRANLVLSTDFDPPANANAQFFRSFEELDAYLESNNFYEEIWVIGGAQIYNHYITSNKIKKCYITYIDQEYECDTFFSPLDMSAWKSTEYEKRYDNTYLCDLDYVVYERKMF